MSMDVHSRYRTEAHDDVVARFNERFILSLGSCESCLVVDDELNVLPISGGQECATSATCCYRARGCSAAEKGAEGRQGEHG